MLQQALKRKDRECQELRGEHEAKVAELERMLEEAMEAHARAAALAAEDTARGASEEEARAALAALEAEVRGSKVSLCEALEKLGVSLDAGMRSRLGGLVQRHVAEGQKLSDELSGAAETAAAALSELSGATETATAALPKLGIAASPGAEGGGGEAPLRELIALLVSSAVAKVGEAFEQGQKAGKLAASAAGRFQKAAGAASAASAQAQAAEKLAAAEAECSMLREASEALREERDALALASTAHEARCLKAEAALVEAESRAEGMEAEAARANAALTELQAKMAAEMERLERANAELSWEVDRLRGMSSARGDEEEEQARLRLRSNELAEQITRVRAALDSGLAEMKVRPPRDPPRPPLDSGLAEMKVRPPHAAEEAGAVGAGGDGDSQGGDAALLEGGHEGGHEGGRGGDGGGGNEAGGGAAGEDGAASEVGGGSVALVAMVEAMVGRYRVVEQLLSKMESELEMAASNLERLRKQLHSAEEGSGERVRAVQQAAASQRHALVGAALSSLASLRTHLVATLSGLREQSSPLHQAVAKEVERSGPRLELDKRTGRWGLASEGEWNQLVLRLDMPPPLHVHGTAFGAAGQQEAPFPPPQPRPLPPPTPSGEPSGGADVAVRRPFTSAASSPLRKLPPPTPVHSCVSMPSSAHEKLSRAQRLSMAAYAPGATAPREAAGLPLPMGGDLGGLDTSSAVNFAAVSQSWQQTPFVALHASQSLGVLPGARPRAANLAARRDSQHRWPKELPGIPLRRAPFAPPVAFDVGPTNAWIRNIERGF